MAENKEQNKKLPRVTDENGMQTIPKNNSAIHISANLSLVARKIFNALLWQAYDYLPVRDVHEIDVKTLGALIGYDSKNSGHLREAVAEIANVTIRWNIFKPDDKMGLKTASLLSSAVIRDGVCYYEYSKLMSNELYNPTTWTRINLAIQREFSSAYALILYENCVRYKNIKTTGHWDIDDFRSLLGVQDTLSYQEFKVLNARVIKPAVKEVNRHSDIIIKPYFTKNGRRVSSVRFTIQENKQLPLFKVEEDDAVSQSKAYKELRKRGISHAFSKKSVMDYGEEYIFEQLAIADNYAAKTPLKGTKQGLIRKAITESYSKPDAIVREERRKEAEKNKAQADRRERQLTELSLKRRKIDRDYREMFLEMVQSVFDLSSDAEQKEILEDFVNHHQMHSFQAGDFRTNRWQSMMNWKEIREYWQNVRQLPCPSFEEFAGQRGIIEIDAKIKELESLQ